MIRLMVLAQAALSLFDIPDQSLDYATDVIKVCRRYSRSVYHSHQFLVLDIDCVAMPTGPVVLDIGMIQRRRPTSGIPTHHSITDEFAPRGLAIECKEEPLKLRPLSTQK
jgi:hypothetical protein